MKNFTPDPITEGKPFPIEKVTVHISAKEKIRGSSIAPLFYSIWNWRALALKVHRGEATGREGRL